MARKISLILIAGLFVLSLATTLSSVFQVTKLVTTDFEGQGMQNAYLGAHIMEYIFEKALANGIFDMGVIFDDDYTPSTSRDSKYYNSAYNHYLERNLSELFHDFLGSSPVYYVYAINTDGYVPVHSNSELSGKIWPGEADKFEIILRGKSTAIRSFTDENGFEYNEYAAPIYIKDRLWGEFRVGIPRGLIKAYAINQISWPIGSAIIFATILVVVIYYSVRRSLLPLTEISQAATKMAEGDYSARAYYDARDEIGRLAATMNIMAEKIEASHNVLEEQVKERTYNLREANAKLISEITEKSLIEKALAKSEDFLNTTGKIARVGGWEYIVMDGLVNWTDTTKIIHEVPLDYQPSLDKALDFYPPHCREMIADAVKKASSDGTPFDLDLEIITAKGNHLWVRAMGKSDFDDGKCIRIYGTFQDVTDLKQAQLQLQNSRDQLSRIASEYYTMLNSVPAILYSKDLSNCYVSVNESFCRYHNVNERDVLGKSDYEIFPPEKADIYRKDDWGVMADEREIINQEESSFDNTGQKIWISVTKIPIRNNNSGVTGMVGLIQDVTEKYTNREHLIQSDKLAAIGTLAAGVAHEINNPIGYINSNLNTMLKYLNKINGFLESESNCSKDKKEELDEIVSDFKDAIEESMEGTSRVKNIIVDLKDFSRIDKKDKEYANLNDGITSTLNIVWNELKYKCEVEKDFGELPDIYCIPNQLNQVFMNLLVNASQAFSGKIGQINIRTRADTENVYISIKDNGCGIPEQNLNKIFEPFFTTKEVGLGTGLGLSLAYDIIQKHGGFIEVKSTVDIGTEFIITLPITVEEQSTAETQTAS